MSPSPDVTPDVAKKVLLEEQEKRMKACGTELDQCLTKYGMLLHAEPIIVDGLIRAKITLVPKKD